MKKKKKLARPSQSDGSYAELCAKLLLTVISSPHPTASTPAPSGEELMTYRKPRVRSLNSINKSKPLFRHDGVKKLHSLWGRNTM